jgi:N-methylhydantoinase A
MAAEGHEESSISLSYRLDVRYKGQSHELTVPWVPGETAVTERFHAAHQLRYGYRLPQGEMMEVVTLRVTAVAPVDPPEVPQEQVGSSDASAAVVGRKGVWFKEEAQPTVLYDREKLRPGYQFRGPAIVFQYDTTLVIPPGWETAVDSYHNLNLTITN